MLTGRLIQTDRVGTVPHRWIDADQQGFFFGRDEQVNDAREDSKKLPR